MNIIGAQHRHLPGYHIAVLVGRSRCFVEWRPTIEQARIARERRKPEEDAIIIEFPSNKRVK